MSTRTVTRSATLLIGLALLMSASGLFAEHAAGLPPRGNPHNQGLATPYTFRPPNPCTSTSDVFADPVNFVWYGPTAQAAEGPYDVAKLLGPWVNFNHDDNYSPFPADHQWVIGTIGSGASHCEQDGDQRADQNPLVNRNHVRLFRTYNGHTQWVVGDAHHDQVVVAQGECKSLGFVPAAHIASSFNSTRDLLASRWASHARVFRVYWGNTLPVKQCNGQRTASNGEVVFAQTPALGVIAGARPHLTGRPAISGTPTVGSTLTAHPGTWVPSPASFEYQWCYYQETAECGTPIPGATSATFVIPAEAAGRQITFQVRPRASTGEFAIAEPVTVGAVVSAPGCGTDTLPANDDRSTSAVTLPFSINFYGNSYSQLWVNNNGNVTFKEPRSTWTPSPFSTAPTPIIAPFFADVDTRSTHSGKVTYGNTTFEGHAAFCVDWPYVGYYHEHSDKLNDFQLLLVDREDLGSGAFDIVFNYDQIQWETGDANGGNDGLGGTSAAAGFSDGQCKTSNFFEIEGSLQDGALLDSNLAKGLIHGHRESSVLGRYVFHMVGSTLTPAVAVGGGGGGECETKEGGGGGGAT